MASYVVAHKLYDSVLLPAKAIAASAIAAAGRGVLVDGRAIARGLIRRTLSVTIRLVVIVAIAAPTVLSAVFGKTYGKDRVTLILLLMSAILPPDGVRPVRRLLAGSPPRRDGGAGDRAGGRGGGLAQA